MSVPFFPVLRLSLTRALINPCLHSVTGLQLFKLTHFCLDFCCSQSQVYKMQYLRSRWRNLVSQMCCFCNFWMSDPSFLPLTLQFTDAGNVFCLVLKMHSGTVSVLEKLEKDSTVSPSSMCPQASGNDLASHRLHRTEMWLTLIKCLKNDFESKQHQYSWYSSHMCIVCFFPPFHFWI